MEGTLIRKCWKVAALVIVVLATAVVVSATASAAKPLRVVQLEFPIPLVARGDRVEVGYDTRGIRLASGFLYVRNDLQARFTRVALTLRRAEQQLVPSDGLKLLRAVVPGRLIRGHKLFYYAVIRDPKSGRSVRVPAGTPETVWVLDGAFMVKLGTHHFGSPATPEALVAAAGPDEVGFENPPEGARYGPWSFDLGPDGSVWLLDELNQRVLVFEAGQVTAQRSVTLPFYPVDFALGPEGTLYATRGGLPGKPQMRLDGLTAQGEVRWETPLATDIFNSQLRFGPDGTLYWTSPGFSPRIERGSERRWTPAASPAGEPFSVAEQVKRTLWGYQPLPGHLRLVAVVARFEPGADGSLVPHEMRYALINRADRVIRAWRVRSRSDIWPLLGSTPGLVDGDPVVVVDVAAWIGGKYTVEYLVLRLGPAGGTPARFSLRHEAFGDVITDIRVGPDGKLYQLGSSPSTGVAIHRFSLGSKSDAAP